MTPTTSPDKIICVGKNYLEHAQELGDAVPTHPVLFLKPPSSILNLESDQPGSIPSTDGSIRALLPRRRGAVHHECEIVFRIGTLGTFEAITLGLDMTLRDLQSDLKKKGHPWETSKVFTHSSILGPWIPISQFPDYLDTEFCFTLDGSLRQKGKGRDMRFSPQECLEAAKSCFPICPGDLLFTGTPAGVGPVQPGQTGELAWGTHLSARVQFVSQLS